MSDSTPAVLSEAELDHTITRIASISGSDQEVDVLLDRIEDHIDALTEQVRVLDTYVSLVNMLKDIVQDADRPVMGLDANNTYEVGSDLIDRARRALAALEGESQDTRTEALDWLLDWTRDQDGGDAIEHFHHINDGIAVHCGCPYQGEGALEGES